VQFWQDEDKTYFVNLTMNQNELLYTNIFSLLTAQIPSKLEILAAQPVEHLTTSTQETSDEEQEPSLVIGTYIQLSEEIEDKSNLEAREAIKKSLQGVYQLARMLDVSSQNFLEIAAEIVNENEK